MGLFSCFRASKADADAAKRPIPREESRDVVPTARDTTAAGKSKAPAPDSFNSATSSEMMTSSRPTLTNNDIPSFGDDGKQVNGLSHASSDASPSRDTSALQFEESVGQEPAISATEKHIVEHQKSRAAVAEATPAPQGNTEEAAHEKMVQPAPQVPKSEDAPVLAAVSSLNKPSADGCDTAAAAAQAPSSERTTPTNTPEKALTKSASSPNRNSAKKSSQTSPALGHSATMPSNSALASPTVPAEVVSPAKNVPHYAAPTTSAAWKMSPRLRAEDVQGVAPEGHAGKPKRPRAMKPSWSSSVRLPTPEPNFTALAAETSDPGPSAEQHRPKKLPRGDTDTSARKIALSTFLPEEQPVQSRNRQPKKRPSYRKTPSGRKPA